MKRLNIILCLLLSYSTVTFAKRLVCPDDKSVIKKIVEKYDQSSVFSKYDRKCRTYVNSGKKMYKCYPLYNYDPKTFHKSTTDEFVDESKTMTCKEALLKIETYLVYSQLECGTRDDYVTTQSKRTMISNLQKKQIAALAGVDKQYADVANTWSWQRDGNANIRYGKYQNAVKAVNKEFTKRIDNFWNEKGYWELKEKKLASACCVGKSCDPY